MPTRKKPLTQKQVKRIGELTKEGKSTRQIQLTLSHEGIGVRRKVLLDIVRAYRARPKKSFTRKYTPTAIREGYKREYYAPKKYRYVRPPTLFAKQVRLTGWHKGKMVQKAKSGTGKELQKFVREEIKNENDFWDARPIVKS